MLMLWQHKIGGCYIPCYLGLYELEDVDIHELIADAYNKSFRFSIDNSESQMHLLRVSQLI